MSTYCDKPRKPAPEMMDWIDSSWGIDDEGVLIWIRDGESRGIKAGDPIYCGLQSNGYMICRTSTKPRRALKAHHLVWYFTTGQWPALSVDHIDGNRSNNSINNLRLATKQQNLQNRKPTKNRMLPKGVNKAYKGNYSSNITTNGCRVYLGYFKTVEAAEQAYRQASLNLHKEFSYYAPQEVI
jgi:hypothetical protein